MNAKSHMGYAAYVILISITSGSWGHWKSSFNLLTDIFNWSLACQRLCNDSFDSSD